MPAPPSSRWRSICGGSATAAHSARVSTLHANTTWATNTISAPKRIVPVNSTLRINGERMSHVVPAYSIEVLEIPIGAAGGNERKGANHD